jgi:hypothetical protein
MYTKQPGRFGRPVFTVGQWCRRSGPMTAAERRAVRLAGIKQAFRSPQGSLLFQEPVPVAVQPGTHGHVSVPVWWTRAHADTPVRQGGPCGYVEAMPSAGGRHRERLL